MNTDTPLEAITRTLLALGDKSLTEKERRKEIAKLSAHLRRPDELREERDILIEVCDALERGINALREALARPHLEVCRDDTSQVPETVERLPGTTE